MKKSALPRVLLALLVILGTVRWMATQQNFIDPATSTVQSGIPPYRNFPKRNHKGDEFNGEQPEWLLSLQAIATETDADRKAEEYRLKLQELEHGNNIAQEQLKLFSGDLGSGGIDGIDVEVESPA